MHDREHVRQRLFCQTGDINGTEILMVKNSVSMVPLLNIFKYFLRLKVSLAMFIFTYARGNVMYNFHTSRLSYDPPYLVYTSWDLQRIVNGHL